MPRHKDAKAQQILMRKASPRGVTRSDYAEPRGRALGAKYAKAQQILMHKASPRGVTRSNYAEPRGGDLGAKDASLS